MGVGEAMGFMGIGEKRTPPVASAASTTPTRKEGGIQQAASGALKHAANDVVDLAKTEAKKTVNTFWEACLDSLRGVMKDVITTALTVTLSTWLVTKVPALKAPLTAVTQAVK